MAIGFSPKYIEKTTLDGLTQEQFLTIAIQTAIEKKWNIVYASNSGLIVYTNQGIFKFNAQVTIKIENETVTITSVSTGNEIIDFGKNKQNVNRYLSTFNRLKSSLSEEEINTKYLDLKDNLAPPEEDILLLPPETRTQKFKNLFSVFIPSPGYFIAPILVDLNILIFILMVISGVDIFSPDSESVLNWGANFRPSTLGGEWWRLLTNCFIHFGIFHLAMNMYALIYIGLLLEPLLGKVRFLSAYLLTGIIASLTSLWWNYLSVSAGASGAIFGMYGVFLALLTSNLIEKSTRKPLLTSIAIFVGLNLLYGLKEGIDNAAHIGGLVSGWIIGYAFIPSLVKPYKTSLKYITISLLSVIVLISSFVILQKIPNDYGIYVNKIEEFRINEKNALSIFDLPQNTPKEKFLSEIKSKGIDSWENNIRLIDSMNDLNLPEDVIARNKLLKEYCELRAKSYQLYYNAYLEDTNQYNDQIETCMKQIESKLGEISKLDALE